MIGMNGSVGAAGATILDFSHGFSQGFERLVKGGLDLRLTLLYKGVCGVFSEMKC